MKQAIMVKPGDIQFREVPVPEMGPEQVTIKLKKIGVCGSDVHVWHGKHPYTSYPVVQGHEVSAVITAVGAQVKDYQVGDFVTVQPQVVCGTCFPCTHGLYNDCNELKVMGFQTTGMASDFFVVDAAKLLHLPAISEDQGAMLEPLAVACHAVTRYGDVAGKNALVVGGGPIGNLVAQVLKARGAKQVLLSELSAYRAGLAQTCGIATVNPAEKPLFQAVLDTFGADCADVIFECIGNAKTIAEEIEIARKGSTIIVVGVVPDLCSVNMGFVQDHELSLIGTAMYRTEDFVSAIELVNDNLVQLDQLITHHVPFSRYPEAYHIIDEQKDRAMKVIIDMD